MSVGTSAGVLAVVLFRTLQRARKGGKEAQPTPENTHDEDVKSGERVRRSTEKVRRGKEPSPLIVCVLALQGDNKKSKDQ